MLKNEKKLAQKGTYIGGIILECSEYSRNNFRTFYHPNFHAFQSVNFVFVGMNKFG